MTDPAIRPAEPRDLAAMLVLKRRAGIAAWRHILPFEVLQSLGMPDRWVAVVRSPGPQQTALVAEVGEDVVAFAITGPSLDDDAGETTGELDGFYADPDVWGRGTGQALLAEATGELLRAGFRDATLWTASENHRPRRIYERAGWRTDGAERRRSLGGTDFTEVRYRIELS